MTETVQNQKNMKESNLEQVKQPVIILEGRFLTPDKVPKFSRQKNGHFLFFFKNFKN